MNNGDEVPEFVVAIEITLTKELESPVYAGGRADAVVVDGRFDVVGVPITIVSVNHLARDFPTFVYSVCNR